MAIDNRTAYSDAQLANVICLVRDLMGYTEPVGEIRFRKRCKPNSWRGRWFFVSWGKHLVKIRLGRPMSSMTYTKRGYLIDPRGFIECVGVAVAHELGHNEGWGEKKCRWAEYTFLQKYRAGKVSSAD